MILTIITRNGLTAKIIMMKIKCLNIYIDQQGLYINPVDQQDNNANYDNDNVNDNDNNYDQERSDGEDDEDDNDEDEDKRLKDIDQCLELGQEAAHVGEVYEKVILAQTNLSFFFFFVGVKLIQITSDIFTYNFRLTSNFEMNSLFILCNFRNLPYPVKIRTG